MPPPSKPPKQPKFNTLTTAGRIAKAAHTCDQAALKSTPTSPPPDSAPPKKKPRKIPVLAPPAELEAEAARRAEAKKKPKPKPKKAPLTTKDKIAASKKKKKKKKQNFGPVEDDEKGFRGGRGGEAKTKGEKPRNLMDIMRDIGQMASKAPVSASSTVAGKVQTVASSGAKTGGKGKAKVKESVLVRPTERTRRMKQSRQRLGETQAAPAAPFVKIKRESGDGASPNAQASLMGIPIELRQRIWRLAVVETQFFVYPAINQEQPDLAMTSRQIRNEVLPLYYGDNTFAIEIPVLVGAGMGKKAKDPERKSLLLVKKWMAAQEDHLGTIRKWALSWAPPPVKDLQAGVRGHTGNREFIVSICYPKPGEGEQATQPEIEIHRQAFCLLKSHELFHPCISMCYPSWLDDAVAAAVLTEGQDRGKQILMIAKDVEKRGGELVGSRCEDDVVELD
ncbi:hypothetical protein Q7P35_008709 [Cladosporium inversicolor]